MGSDESGVETPSLNSRHGRERESFVTIVKDLVDDLRGSPSSGGKDVPTLHRYRHAITKTAPRVNTSVKLASADLVYWMNRGGPWRAFLILSGQQIFFLRFFLAKADLPYDHGLKASFFDQKYGPAEEQTGITTSVGLSGVFIFLLFLITATVNTVIIALLGSVAAVGAVAALFFTALTGIYIGVLAVAACVISTIVFFTIVAVLTVAGWIAFWWVVYLGLKKSYSIAQGSLAYAGSTLQNTVSSVRA